MAPILMVTVVSEGAASETMPLQAFVQANRDAIEEEFGNESAFTALLLTKAVSMGGGAAPLFHLALADTDDEEPDDGPTTEYALRESLE